MIYSRKKLLMEKMIQVFIMKAMQDYPEGTFILLYQVYTEKEKMVKKVRRCSMPNIHRSSECWFFWLKEPAG